MTRLVITPVRCTYHETCFGAGRDGLCAPARRHLERLAKLDPEVERERQRAGARVRYALRTPAQIEAYRRRDRARWRRRQGGAA